jgi:hypothetical protein
MRGSFLPIIHLFAAVAACGPDPGFDPVAPLPARWRALESALAVHGEPFEPLYPLGGDGLTKERVLFVPEGAEIETDAGQYDFPVGTVFVKSFFAPSAQSTDHDPIERRVLVRTSTEWRYGVYVWDETVGDAVLTTGAQEIAVPYVDVQGNERTHIVPSTRQCRTCHESGTARILGYDDVQLGRVPLSTTLDEDALEIAGFFRGNCTHCHNGSRMGSAAFDLRADVFLANTLCAQTTGSASGIGVRIDPGSPSTSILYRAMAGGDAVSGIKAMPPLGVDRPDPESLERMRRFIESLSDERCEEGVR